MKNILTIDFDIIMKDSIELYNNFAQYKSWNERYSLSPLLKNLPFDSCTYYKLTKFLMKQIFPNVSKEKIFFLKNHQDVLKYLSKEDQYNIFNIDHHHDWCYNEKDYQHPINMITCGNWVKYLNDNKQLNSYTWINNSNSVQPIHNIKIKQHKISNSMELHFCSNFDEVYCILSPEYVPPYYHYMFFLWIDIANNIHNTFFELE